MLKQLCAERKEPDARREPENFTGGGGAGVSPFDIKGVNDFLLQKFKTRLQHFLCSTGSVKLISDREKIHTGN